MKAVLTHRRTWIVVLCAVISLAGYLFAARQTNSLGFPLDDSWIHQTYARSLGQRGEWSFIPGVVSGGSTSPLWTLLLALGYGLGLASTDNPTAWAYCLGWLSLVGVAAGGLRLFQALRPKRGQTMLWVGLFLVFEWHMAWAAGSGMETLLQAAVALFILSECLRPQPSWWLLGMGVGVSMWVRPDGLTLLGPVLAAWMVLPGSLRLRLARLWRLGIGFAVMATPYLVFNQIVAGAIWPNTFFAKQMEYAAQTLIPYWRRWLNLNSLPLVGAGALLLPGFGLWLWRAARRRAWRELAVAAWLLGYLAIYAWRLPVVYQHGRYVMPAMPVFFVLSLAGMSDWLDLQARSMLRRVFSRSWAAALILVSAVFWLRGAMAYAQDTAIIQTEMATTAKWVASHTPANALVAAHDIGALGYYAQRPLVDLAGLISPEVIPFIRDEARLRVYLNQRGVAYLVVFPGWYNELTNAGRLVFQTGGRFSPAQGGQNMAVYEWRP